MPINAMQFTQITITTKATTTAENKLYLPYCICGCYFY